jgi:hypothetical protein
VRPAEKIKVPVMLSAFTFPFKKTSLDDVAHILEEEIVVLTTLSPDKTPEDRVVAL